MEGWLFSGVLDRSSLHSPHPLEHRVLSFNVLWPIWSLEMTLVPPWVGQWSLATVQTAGLLSRVDCKATSDPLTGLGGPQT